MRNVQIVVKPKQSGSGPYITTKPIFINRHVSNIIVLVPANERELHESQQVHVGCDGGHVQDEVVEDQVHVVDRLKKSFGGKL